MSLPPFQTLVDEHARDVHRLLVASVGPLDADDCYQETFMAALKAYPELQNVSNLRGWLLTIAHRKAIDHHRRRARIAVPAGDAHAIGRDLATEDREPQDSPWPAVRGLPDKQRMAVALRYALDLDFKDVGRAMGITPEAARRNVHEGLLKLREEYTDDRA